uniref:Uncharacterized protein n=1 Tax=Physcomitrium patens TaxID=3218 RepID=A0A2K1I9M3_PHYPA|nr:hypothetical protein PHYPA_031260 [Physcomitrium patens]
MKPKVQETRMLRPRRSALDLVQKILSQRRSNSHATPGELKRLLTTSHNLIRRICTGAFTTEGRCTTSICSSRTFCSGYSADSTKRLEAFFLVAVFLLKSLVWPLHVGPLVTSDVLVYVYLLLEI